MSLYFALWTVENSKNEKSVEFRGGMLCLCDFVQVYMFTTNHHLNAMAQLYVCTCPKVLGSWDA